MRSGRSVVALLAPEEKRLLLAEWLGAQPGDRVSGTALIAEASVYAHRRLFPGLAGKSYFNYGARGPMPLPALDAIRQALDTSESIGPFSHEALVFYEHSTESLRQTLAGIFSVAMDSIALTENTTTACNIALWGIDWKPGDHLLLSDCEHLSAIAVAQAVRDRCGIQLTSFNASQAANGAELLEAFDRAVRPETRLVLVSHVLWNTGLVTPLASLREIATERTAGRCQVLVDGAQAAGLLDAEPEWDFYAFPASKWFCGPAGVGALIVAPEALERLRPVFGGWRGAAISEPDGAVRWRDGARRYEAGTSCQALYCGWDASIRVQREWGDSNVRVTRAREMGRAVWNRLTTMRENQELPPGAVVPADPPGAGILTLRLPDPEAVVSRLEVEGVYVRSIPYPASLRICTHYLTSCADLQRLTDALARAWH